MKPAEKKLEFIRLRADGKSLRAIEKELSVSRSTLSEWEKELSAEIYQLRQDNLTALYETYGAAREARIRRIGETLSRIDAALDKVNFEEISPEKLLDYKLKYQNALRDEYSSSAFTEATGAAEDTLEAFKDIRRRAASGEITTDQAKTEINLLDHMVDGYRRKNPLEDMFTM